VIDTKWKCLKGAIDDSKRGVGQADVYQMMAYAHIYECDRLMLLCPHHESVEQDSVVSIHRIINKQESLLGLLLLIYFAPRRWACS
jgi:5-methylcytosine-specific restriction enzyme subunit McrC